MCQIMEDLHILHISGNNNLIHTFANEDSEIGNTKSIVLIMFFKGKQPTRCGRDYKPCASPFHLGDHLPHLTKHQKGWCLSWYS